MKKIRATHPLCKLWLFYLGYIITRLIIIRRQHAAGVTRTQSGSYIPNLSKQPTPAPSTSERDDDYGRAGEFGPENTDMAVDINGQGLPAVSHS